MANDCHNKKKKKTYWNYWNDKQTMQTIHVVLKNVIKKNKKFLYVDIYINIFTWSVINNLCGIIKNVEWGNTVVVLVSTIRNYNVTC